MRKWSILTIGCAACYRNGRTLVPVRGVFESINADVEWVPESKKVNVYKNDIVITLKSTVT